MKRNLTTTLATIFITALPQIVFAAAQAGGLPWETPLQTVQSSITGPVAITVALVAIAVAGGMLIFGGEINNFARMGVYITLVLGLLVMANNFLQATYNTGSVIPDHLANQQPQPISNKNG